LNSPINWVRNQALILIGGSQASARAVGSDLATEMGYDLANGLLPIRLSAYGKAVYAAGNRSHWWSLLVGAFCSLTNLVLLLTVAAAIYFGLWSLSSVSIEPREVSTQISEFKMSDWIWHFDETKRKFFKSKWILDLSPGERKEQTEPPIP